MATEDVEKVEISKDDRFSDPHIVPIDAPLILLECLFVTSVLLVQCT